MVLILGAGKMGRAIAFDLEQSKISYRVCDKQEMNIPNFFRLDITNTDKFIEEIHNEDLVISCIPYDFNYNLASIAVKQKVNFIDLGGNSYIVDKELTLHNKAKENKVVVIPDCGLAPGMTNIIAYNIWKNNDDDDDVHIRVGGLPQHPKPPLNYALFFSVHGLINEYLENSIIIQEGNKKEVESLTGVEQISFNNMPELEAFYTHGGTSTLVHTLKNVNNLDYKTIRYAGHAEALMMFKKLGFFNEDIRTFTEDVLEKNIEHDAKDIVLARVYDDNTTYEMVDIYDDEMNLSAMARTTGFPTAIIGQMILNSELEYGAYPPEIAVSFERFLSELKKRKVIWKKI